MVFCLGKYRQNEAGNFFLLAFSVNKSIGNNIFLLPIDLITNRKLPTQDLPMEHVRL